VHILKSAQTPDGKPGRELASRAEGFFCLDFLVLLCQDKRVAPAAMSGTELLVKTKIPLLKNEADLIARSV
jgi:hypothetical protein